MTMVNVWWEQTPYGLWCGQGQLLPWFDERSFFCFNLCLITAPGYSSFAIRNSWTDKAAEWGLPRIGFALECGMWKTSRLLKGRPQNEVSIWRGRNANSRFLSESEVSPMPLEESELGLKKLGLKFKHYTTPRGKIIENVFGKSQNYFQSLPGYVGRNALADKYERVQKEIALVRDGKEHPAKFFLEKEEMMAKLMERFHKQNITAKFGKYHRGRSPKELLLESYEKNPPIQIGPEYRYFLASNKIPVIPGRNGIGFRFGEKTFNYKSAETGEHQGKELFGLFNAERPELLHVTDRKNNYLFSVNLETPVKNHDPEPGTMEQSGRENAAHAAYHKDKFCNLHSLYESEFGLAASRRLVVDAKTARTGEAIRKKEAQLDTERKRATSLNETITQRVRNAGMAPAIFERSERADEFIQGMEEADRLHRLEVEQEQPSTSEEK